MKGLVLLMRRRSSEDEMWTDYFMAEDSSTAEENLRAAIKEFALTEEGIKTIKITSEDFNWGDAVMYVPERIWNNHGLTSIDDDDKISIGKAKSIIVDQDEILIPVEYYELEVE